MPLFVVEILSNEWRGKSNSKQSSARLRSATICIVVIQAKEMFRNQWVYVYLYIQYRFDWYEYESFNWTIWFVYVIHLRHRICISIWNIYYFISHSSSFFVRRVFCHLADWVSATCRAATRRCGWLYTSRICSISVLPLARYRVVTVKGVRRKRSSQNV